MHFQIPPHSDMKLISCLKGAIFDVAIDIRPLSKTYLNWYSTILDENNHRTLIIPEGFAHGFQTLTDDCELIYFHTNSYDEESDRSINALDKKININWPLSVTEISKKDKEALFITNQFKGIEL
jgi:dTDP-4-dehydrorhamnose 3,5-epimerase